MVFDDDTHSIRLAQEDYRQPASNAYTFGFGKKKKTGNFWHAQYLETPQTLYPKSTFPSPFFYAK
jgi:hypothetical protein